MKTQDKNGRKLILTRAEADEWTRRNPHARPGILDALASRGVMEIVEFGGMSEMGKEDRYRSGTAPEYTNDSQVITI